MGKLELCEITADYATLHWLPPKDTGGSDISGYTVEKRENDTCNWTMVSNSISRTNCRIPSLITGLEYTFRVMAENRVGLSPSVATQPALAKYSLKCILISSLTFVLTHFPSTRCITVSRMRDGCTNMWECARGSEV